MLTPGYTRVSTPSTSHPGQSRSARQTNIAFRNPETSKQHFTRASAKISSGLADSLCSLLIDSPDPDSAILLFDRLVSEATGEVLRLLERHHFLAHYAVTIFGQSRYLSETLLQNPDLLQRLARERTLDASFSREDYREAFARFKSRSSETDISAVLAQFKRREYVRIMLRDVLKLATLAETTAEMSALSDVLIESALSAAETELQRRFGLPEHLGNGGRIVQTRFAVLSLGKLGGNELNYCSDIDLLYLYGEEGAEVPEKEISNREYFTRLAQKLTEFLSRITREGPPFRIDLRLRPQGKEGELAVSFDSAVRYYADSAQDWERQALIKARYSAGDSTLARDFLRAVQPFVYTQEINFAAIKTALMAREKMTRKRRIASRPTAQIDIKIDLGGIRDIEFLVQCLQRVYGGHEPWLRSVGTLFSLQKLHDKGHITGREYQDLTSAYEFLRHLEHRLQLRHGQQTHRLPQNSAEQAILWHSIAELLPEKDRNADLTTAVQQRMGAVSEIYNRLVYHQRSREALGISGFQLRRPGEAESERVKDEMLERLSADAPEIYRLTQENLSAHTRRNLLRFLTSAHTSSERYAVLLRNAGVVAQALPLFETSEYLTGLLVRYPGEIETFAELPQKAASSSAWLPLKAGTWQRTDPDPAFQYIVGLSASYSEKLSLLRKHYRHREFVSGLRDVLEFPGVYESLALTTGAAEEAIAAALAIVAAPAGLAVMALGRLGTGEFDLLSDADLIFVCSEDDDHQVCTAKAGQIMQMLAACTQDGIVFSADPRLRPHGTQGELVTTPRRLSSYFLHEAQAWEALSYTKLRFIAGAPHLQEEVNRARSVLFQRFSSDHGFARAVWEMRSKVESGTERNLKTSPGGVYDIDFLCSYLLILSQTPEKGGTLRDRIWRCADSGALTNSDAAALDHAGEFLRTIEHVIRLVTGRAGKWLPVTDHALHVTAELTASILGLAIPADLGRQLDEIMQSVREIYARVLTDCPAPE